MTGIGNPERLVCLIVARQLGDAAIESGFLRALAARGFATQYLVWTRPHFAFLFEDIPACRVVCSQFPLGTTKHFNAAAAIGLLNAAKRIRQFRPSLSIDLLGDFRERCLARLTGSRRHFHIGWSRDHPFARIIRNPFGTGRPLICVPPAVRNIYAAYDLMLDALAPPRTAANSKRAAFQQAQPDKEGKLVVGLHPFASQRCKLWPEDSWRSLIRELRVRGVAVVAFSAPDERPSLERLLGDMRPEVTLFSEDLASFAAKVKDLDVLVGLDSFSIHMAYLQGVRSVTINSGNPPDLWAPPGGVSLWSSGGCTRYPCFNVPSCERSPREYACVRSIGVQQVVDAIL